MAFALDLSSPSDSFSQQLRVSHSSSQQLPVFIYSPWDSSSCLGLLLLSWLLGEVESCQHEFLSCSGIPRSGGREGPGHPRSPGQPPLGLPVHAGCLPALRQASGFHLGFAFYFQTYMQKKTSAHHSTRSQRREGRVSVGEAGSSVREKHQFAQSSP